jgi:biopolymer transport protein ExbB
MSGFLFPILEYCRSGGLMMVPIIAVSLVMWSLILIKLQEIHEINRNDVEILETVSRVRNGVGLQTTGTPLSHVVFHFMEQITGDRQLNQDLLISLVNRETSRLSKNINIIYVLASIAPLLGLLGTVGGMITTFDAIAMYGTGNARAMAQGISAALITTQSGLFVSIPGLFMASFLHRRIGRIAQQLDEFRAAMMKEMNLNFHQSMG